MSKKEKRSRGPECISQEEYEEICREEDKKMLDSTFVEPNTIDEVCHPSIDIISESCFDDNDYDFEVEDKELELSPMMKQRISKKLELVDGKIYDSTLKDIHSNFIEYRDLSILSFIYSVKVGENSFKDVEDSFFFDNNNSRSFTINEERLERMLRKYGVTLSDDDYDDVKSLEKAVRHLIGKKVSMVQSTNRDFKNYKIIKVLN